MANLIALLCLVGLSTNALVLAQSDLEVGSGEYDENIPPECRLIPDRGFGYRKTNNWYYDPAEKRCRWFRYLGYGGNANRFISRSACMARCIHNVWNPCDAVDCKGGKCEERKMICANAPDRRVVRNTPDDTLFCPPNYAMCYDNLRFKYPTIPKIEYYDFSRPLRCTLLVDTGIWQKDTHYRMVYYYSARERTCKSTYAPASAISSVPNPSSSLMRSEEASETIQRNLFLTLDECMDTCTV